MRRAGEALGLLLAAAAFLAGLGPSSLALASSGCNGPAPAWYRRDVAAVDGRGLHHESAVVQALFFAAFGAGDDLHVRSWAWQHDGCPGPPEPPPRDMPAAVGARRDPDPPASPRYAAPPAPAAADPAGCEATPEYRRGAAGERARLQAKGFHRWCWHQHPSTGWHRHAPTHDWRAATPG